MQTQIPTFKKAFIELLRADLTTQWRNRKSVLISSLMVPAIILFTFKELAEKLGGAFVISTSIGMGLIGIGLMGYSNSIARDRDKDVFQRLRVAPIPSSFIMVSRILVQLIMIFILVTFTFVGGYYFDQITLSPIGYLFGGIMAIIGGALYLGLGQALVGLIKNGDTVNSTSRLVYIVFIMVGMFGDTGSFGPDFTKTIKFSPYGSVKCILSSGLDPTKWNNDSTIALIVTLIYTIIFAAIGIKWFKWNSR